MQTTDLYLAGYLSALGKELKLQRNGAHVSFVFDDELTEEIQAFYLGRGDTVSAQQYARALKSLKAFISMR